MRNILERKIKKGCKDKLCLADLGLWEDYEVNLPSHWSNARQLLLHALSGTNGAGFNKDEIRAAHKPQRIERSIASSDLLRLWGPKLLRFFAEGSEIYPEEIRPKLVLVTDPSSENGMLFRLACLLWSIPVSKGYGRRMRYLVLDEQNSKVIGLFALGDPIFNLRCRDEWIGWNLSQRQARLSFMLDAYILGAVPPYSFLLGGKMVGALLTSSEVQDTFRAKYSESRGLISDETKDSYLVLLTTMSALGRSSIYNRLTLPGIVEFERIGRTEGWGHFMVSEDVFMVAREILKETDDYYYNNYKFGQGPNWRFRVLKRVCKLLDIDDDLLRHGIQREVYAIRLATNWQSVLHGRENQPTGQRHSAAEIGVAARYRWIIERAKRTNEWKYWTRELTWSLLTQYTAPNTAPIIQETLWSYIREIAKGG